MSWNDDFWTRLAGDQPSLRFDMYYRKRDDLRLPVEIVAGEPRVPVDDHVLGLLDKVNQKVLFERVKDERQRRNWVLSAAAVRAAVGKTISLYTAVTATLVPIGAVKRSTINLNVYTSLWFKVDALRNAVDPDLRETLRPLKRPLRPPTTSLRSSRSKRHDQRLPSLPMRVRQRPPRSLVSRAKQRGLTCRS